MSTMVVMTCPTVRLSTKRWIDAVTALLLVVRGQVRMEQGNVMGPHAMRARAHGRERGEDRGRIEHVRAGVLHTQHPAEEPLPARPDNDRPSECVGDVTGMTKQLGVARRI